MNALAPLFFFSPSPPHLPPIPRGEILDCVSILDTTNLGWVLRASSLFSLGKCPKVFNVVYLLPIYNRSRWMLVFMCYMWELACIIGRDHDVLAPEAGGAWNTKDAHLLVVRSAGRDPTGIMDVALIRVCNSFSRICW